MVNKLRAKVERQSRVNYSLLHASYWPHVKTSSLIKSSIFRPRVAVARAAFSCGRLEMEVLQMTTAIVMATLPVYTPYRLAPLVTMDFLRTTRRLARQL